MLINTPISVGELIDKITILVIKNDRITQPEKLTHIQKELTALQQVAKSTSFQTDAVAKLQQALLEVNQRLWDIEDAIRVCEKNQDFSDTFVQLARQVYFQNDTRAKIKLDINKLTGSQLIEMKSYEKYA